MKKDSYKNLSVFNFSNIIKKNFFKKKLRGIIFGNFGAMNFGDEAILTGELKELRKIKGLRTTVVSRNPKTVEKLHKVKAIQLYNLEKVVREINKSDFVIVGGGGIICKADRGMVGFLYQLYMLFIYLFLPKMFNKKIYALGIGVYQNTNPIILYLATKLLKLCEMVTVRDYHSCNYLESKGIEVKLYKDNSFLMNLLPKNVVLKENFFRKYFDKNKTNVGLSLVQPEKLDDEKKLISEITKFVKKNYKHANFWFYNCDFQGKFFNDELFSHKVHDQIVDKVGDEVRSFFVPTDLSTQKFFSSFRLMDNFITMRLHASIFSYRNKIDFTSIPYDYKCLSFLNSIGKTPKIILDIDVDKKLTVTKTNKSIAKSVNDLLFFTLTRTRRVTYILLGLFDKLTLTPKNKITVLSYHSVNEDNWRFSMDAREIKKQISFLKKHYDILTIKKLEECLNGSRQILKPSIVITFDDGYKDILKLKKFFKKNNIKPALFVLADPKNASLEELDTNRPMLNANDIISLHKSGWEIGSHSNTHANLSRADSKGLTKEILGSKKILEKELGIPINYFAYPKGKYTKAVLNQVAKSKYRLGLTMDDGVISSNTNPLLIPRIGIDRTHAFSEFRAAFSPSTIAFRGLIKNSFMGRYI